MVEAGIVGPDERIEVFHGNLLPMNAKGPLHETIKQHLTIHFIRHLPREATVIQEAGWRIVDTLYLEPDYLFFPAALNIAAVTGPDALLVVEIADSTFRYDAGVKAGAYASIGVRDYWVIEAASRRTVVHRDPEPDGRFRSVRTVPATETLEALLVPGLDVSLADLPA